MIAVVLWIGLAFLCALPAQKKPIGFGTVLIIGLLLSPLVGLIVAVVSKEAAPPPAPLNYNEEMLKLVTLKEKGIITEEEYNKQKEKLDYEKANPIRDLRTLNAALDRKEITQDEYLVLLKKYK